MPLLPNASMCFSLHRCWLPSAGFLCLVRVRWGAEHTPVRAGSAWDYFAGSSPLPHGSDAPSPPREGKASPAWKRVRSASPKAPLAALVPSLVSLHSTDTRKVTDKPTENTHARLSAALRPGRYGAHTTGHTPRERGRSQVCLRPHSSTSRGALTYRKETPPPSGKTGTQVSRDNCFWACFLKTEERWSKISNPSQIHTILISKIKMVLPARDTASQDLDVGTCSFGESHRSQLGALQQTRPRTPADRVTAHSRHLPALPSCGHSGRARSTPRRPPARTPG